MDFPLMDTCYSTQRLYLHIIKENQAQQVYDFYQKNLSFLKPYEPYKPDSFYQQENLQRVLSLEYRGFSRHTFMRYWICTKSNPSEFIGSVCFHHFRTDAVHACEIGYKLSKEECKKGYMTEALSFLIPLIAKNFDLHRMEAFIMPSNLPSIHLLQKMGFQEEGLLQEYALIRKKWEDHLLFSHIFSSQKNNL